MNIKIDEDFSLKSDPRNIILVQNKIVQEGDNKGTDYESPIGYYGTVESALKGYLDYRIKISVTSSLSTEDPNGEIKFINGFEIDSVEIEEYTERIEDEKSKLSLNQEKW